MAMNGQSVNQRLRDALSRSPSRSPPSKRRRSRSGSPNRVDSSRRFHPSPQRNGARNYPYDDRHKQFGQSGRNGKRSRRRGNRPTSSQGEVSRRPTQFVKPKQEPAHDHRDGFGKFRPSDELHPNMGKQSRRPSDSLSYNSRRGSSSHGEEASKRSSFNSENSILPSETSFATDRKDMWESSKKTQIMDVDVANEPPAAPQQTDVEGAGDTSPKAAEPAVVELSIEERRKRREAIRAKYHNSSDTFLKQALGGDSTTASLSDRPHTPGSLSQRSETPSQEQGTDRSDMNLLTASPAQGTPKTPMQMSFPGSPEAVVADDSELTNKRSNAQDDDKTEERSAADYETIYDMQDDRLRHDARLKNAETFAKDDKEDARELHDVPLPTTEDLDNGTQNTDTKVTAADDMFASDDDDDDMFADEKPEKRTKDHGPSSNYVSKKQPKVLPAGDSDDWDDPEGYYKFQGHELMDGRYHGQYSLGRGMFSSVIRAEDQQTKNQCAIKIVRNNESMKRAGYKEISILEKLSEADPNDKKHLIRLERHFMHKGHLCMVFENLDTNLRELLKKVDRENGLHMTAVRSYAQQMFLALSLLRKCNILHADLKPDNMLVNEERTTLKVCDLGSAADATDSDITPYLVSRFYRAPEIILGIKYDFAIDMWSVGCTLFELYTSKILFTGRNNNQMLRAMQETLGKFSPKVIRKAEFGPVHFEDKSFNFRSVERNPVTGRDNVRTRKFAKVERDLKTRLLAAAPKPMTDADRKELLVFADLLERCLAPNPAKRYTPTDALNHPFINRAATKNDPPGKTALGPVPKLIKPAFPVKRKRP